MGVESPYKHDLAHEALLPALVASAVSFFTFAQLRPATPYFPIHFTYALDARDVLVAIPLGLAAGVASHAFLWTLGQLRRRFDGLSGSVVVRTTAGGVAVALVALVAWQVVGAPVTLGAGLPVSNQLMAGQYAIGAALAIFALKLLATSVTFGCGGVGGLFVPSATMGAALGAVFDAVFAPSHPGVFTLLGIAAFTGASYNSILFAAVFVAEATGNVFLVVPSLVASSVAFVTAARVSNSRSQRRRRPDWRERLETTPVAAVMTRRVVTASAGQTLEAFSRAVLLEHHYKALPVVDGEGALLGMVGLGHLRGVPESAWGATTVGQVLDREARALPATGSAADAEEALRRGPYDYVPVVEAGSARLVGIVSDSDLARVLGADHPTAA
jgi:CIC family chloride channel protein